ncbi:MAG: hypothetical protein Fur0011_5290 [Candidatus Microgenomates bacterium]
MINMLLKLLLCIWVVFYPSRVAAFVDDFSSDVSLQNYVISTNSGSVKIESGKLVLSANSNATQYPLVKLKPELIGIQANDVSVSFRYSVVGIFGAGIVIDNHNPINGINYDVGHNSIAWTWNWGAPPKLRIGWNSFNYIDAPNQLSTHTLRVTGSPGYYEIFLDDTFVGITYSTKPITNIWFGNPEIVSTTSSWPVIEIDSIYIDELPQLFPYISQKNPLWKDVIYDSANEWAGDQENTIERWGCAITSVAMVLKQYGVKMPNGDQATPEKINQWLIDQPDGYVGNGLLNWLAISRLVKESRAVNNATKDLEFVKSSGSATEEIDEGYYPIINEGGHFVVAHDHDGDYYQINDPNNEQRSQKLKTDQIVSVNTYIPSDTDLSYLMIIGKPTTNISLKSENGYVGESYIENINDDVGGGDTGSSLITYFRNPPSGVYKLDVKNNSGAADRIAVYAYDLHGDVDIVNLDIPVGDSYWDLYYQKNGDDPIIEKRDTDPPIYTGTNSFTGWYNQPQVAVFSFEDQNLPSDFVMPSCTISNEGYGQTCKIETTVCDAYDNCASHTLISNPVNIDLTKPATTRKIWGVGIWPLSHVHWLPAKDAEQYRIEWGKDKNSLNSSYTTKKTWAWIPTPKYHKLYVRVIVIDRAGNESINNKVTELPVWRGYWKF